MVPTNLYLLPLRFRRRRPIEILSSPTLGSNKVATTTLANHLRPVAGRRKVVGEKEVVAMSKMAV